jgi:hypothetical protein
VGNGSHPAPRGRRPFADVVVRVVVRNYVNRCAVVRLQWQPLCT